MTDRDSDTYASKAASYGQLPWVNDTKLFALLADMMEIPKIRTIIDLGCGPAAFATFLANNPPSPGYIGFDHSEPMLQKARETMKSHSFAQFLNRDITDESFGLKSQGSSILVKNVLHLIPDYLTFLSRLSSRFPQSTHLAIEETVSPDAMCLEWIQGLFWRLGKHHKKNWFERQTFKQSIKAAGLIFSKCRLYEQIIDADIWLKSFGINEAQQSLIESYFETMPVTVRRKMKFRIEGGRKYMLRLQILLSIRF